MRDKILQFFALTGGTIDSNIDALMHGFETSWKQAAGDPLPPEVVESLAVLRQALVDDKQTLENKVVEIASAKLDESILDALIAFHQSDAAKKLKEVTPDIVHEVDTATLEWAHSMRAKIESRWQELLKMDAPETAASELPADGVIPQGNDLPPVAGEIP